MLLLGFQERPPRGISIRDETQMLTRNQICKDLGERTFQTEEIAGQRIKAYLNQEEGKRSQSVWSLQAKKSLRFPQMMGGLKACGWREGRGCCSVAPTLGNWPEHAPEAGPMEPCPLLKHPLALCRLSSSLLSVCQAADLACVPWGGGGKSGLRDGL